MATTTAPSPPPTALLKEPPATTDETPPIPRRVWLGFLVVITAAVMDLLDSTIAQTAAPAIRADLGGSYTSIEWISASYTLALAVGLLVGGRLGDLFGRRRVLLIGMAGFTGASVLCALAPSTDALIAARVLQGAVGAIMLPQGFGLIRELFGDAGQQKAFAVFGPVMGMSAVLGPVLGGALVDLDLFGTGWRAIFLVNLPIGIAAIWMGRRYLPDVPPSAPGGRIDLPSIGLAGFGVFAVIYPLIEGRELGWPAWSVALVFAGLGVLAAFGVRQGKLARGGDGRRAPLVDPSILRRRAYVGGLVLVVCFIGAMGGMILALNVMLQAGLGFTPLECGVATIAIPLTAILGSITSSVLLERLGRTTIHIGTATMATGLVLVDLVLRDAGADLSAWSLAAPLALTGFGMGMVFVPMFDVILAGVLPTQLGSASGLLESVQQFGMSLGIAVVGTVLFDVVGDGTSAAVFVRAADHALLVAVGFLVAAFTVTWWLPRHAREQG
ncbi:putative transport protein HsrA [Paraconexibacter sp. AEG42_29]|uniref:Transport protein HsrA n=1 Tax=Paraconexibacter sp. AEG42_29 TaxID=2997339 RepID=A0AAU7ARI8_9ACTN